MNIAEILEAQAQRSGDRPAIVEPGRTISFAELNRAAASLAAELTGSGVRAGMRAVVLCQMSIPLYVTMIGLFRLGATAVFPDPSIGRRRLDASIDRVRPDAFIGVPRAHVLRLLSRSVRAIPRKFTLSGWTPGAGSIGRKVAAAPARVIPCDPATPAIITFTSGSTGEPKAAVRSHGFLAAQHRALAGSLELSAGEVDLCTLPIFLLGNLASGVTSVIPEADLRAPGSIDPGPVAAQIENTRPVRTVASPAFLARLAGHAADGGRRFETFRRIYTGGAPVFPRVMDGIARAAPHASIVAVYGSTEAEPIAKIDRTAISDHDRARMVAGEGLLAGRPVSSIELRVITDQWGTGLPPMSQEDFDALRLDANETGEIVVSGEHVLSGYLDGVGDEETKLHVASQVWHRTGDAGYVDREGRLWLMGRCSAKAVEDGGVTYPFAVECAAMESGEVSRCAFVLHRGRRLLVVEHENNPSRVRTVLLERLSWARLDDVLRVPRVPVDRRHNAKVDYPALLRMLERLHAVR